MDTLEVVIVAAEYGEGKRSQWLATFGIAVRDSATGDLLTIGRVGTGFKEKDDEGLSFSQLTQMLLPIVTREEDRTVQVQPKIVIEVDYEEIQQSPTYESGYALRFPRFVRLREDRSAQDISTIDDVEALYRAQRGRNSQG
jgi:DNA ligase-1